MRARDVGRSLVFNPSASHAQPDNRWPRGRLGRPVRLSYAVRRPQRLHFFDAIRPATQRVSLLKFQGRPAGAGFQASAGGPAVLRSSAVPGINASIMAKGSERCCPLLFQLMLSRWLPFQRSRMSKHASALVLRTLTQVLCFGVCAMRFMAEKTRSRSCRPSAPSCCMKILPRPLRKTSRTAWPLSTRRSSACPLRVSACARMRENRQLKRAERGAELKLYYALLSHVAKDMSVDTAVKGQVPFATARSGRALTTSARQMSSSACTSLQNLPRSSHNSSKSVRTLSRSSNRSWRSTSVRILVSARSPFKLPRSVPLRQSPMPWSNGKLKLVQRLIVIAFGPAHDGTYTQIIDKVEQYLSTVSLWPLVRTELEKMTVTRCRLTISSSPVQASLRLVQTSLTSSLGECSPESLPGDPSLRMVNT